MEKKMETIGVIGVTLGLYWDNGKENGNYRGYGGLSFRVICFSNGTCPRLFPWAC